MILLRVRFNDLFISAKTLTRTCDRLIQIGDVSDQSSSTPREKPKTQAMHRLEGYWLQIR